MNGRDVQRKNVVNNVDKSSLWAPWQNGPYITSIFEGGTIHHNKIPRRWYRALNKLSRLSQTTWAARLTGTNQLVFRPQNHQDLQLLPFPTSRHPSCPLILWMCLSVPCWWQVDCRFFPPPGRRDWIFVPHALVSFPKNMTWPPSNWQSLTPDQRTLLTEHLCTSLILHKRQSIPSWAELLLRYQALLLPGSAIRPSKKTFVRMLEASYHMVHAIASGQCRSSLDLQRKTLDTFTSMDEDSIDENIMKAFKDVPLRLWIPDQPVLQMTDLTYRINIVLKYLKTDCYSYVVT